MRLDDLVNLRHSSEELFMAVYEYSPFGIELYDAEGKLRGANKACLDIFGVDDISAVSGFNLFDDPNLSEQHKNSLRKGRTVEQEVLFDFGKVRAMNLYPTSKQGTIHLDLFIMPLGADVEGMQHGYLVYVSDISARKNAEILLLEQKRFVENLILNSAVATFVLDRDHKVVLWNRACEELTGVRAADMMGTSNHWKPFYGRERLTLADIIIDGTHQDRDKLYGKSRRSNLIPEAMHAEGWFSNMNGKDRYIAFDAAPIRDSRGQLVVGVETLLDMTDYKQAEEDLKSKTVELIRSNAELENFAHVVSHDLKAPLMSIGGFAELLLEQYGDRLDENGRSLLTHIFDGTIRMERLISDLLSYARVAAQRRTFESVDCNVTLDTVMFNLKSAVEESKARITSDNLPVLTGDRTQVIQLFQNLIGNAIKYRSDEPLLVHVSAKPIVESGGQQANDDRDEDSLHGKGWLFSVSDNGIGVATIHAERIFQIFERLYADEKTYPGTGVGLAICKKIVESMGGRIWVESEAGKGSTFYFTAPDRMTRRDSA